MHVYMCIDIFIYTTIVIMLMVKVTVVMRIGGKWCSAVSHRLPDRVGTNGPVAEVPQFSLRNVHGKVWSTYEKQITNVATCGNIWQHVRTKSNKLQNVAARAHRWQVVLSC